MVTTMYNKYSNFSSVWLLVKSGIENRDKVYSAILLGCVRLGNLDLDFKIRILDLQSNTKSENGFQR